MRLLEGVLAEHWRDGLARDHDDGRGVHQGGEQPRDGVRGPRPGGHQHHPGSPRGAGVAVGHVGGALLVAHLDQLDLRIQQGVEHGHGRSAGEAEDVFHAFALETLDQLFAAGRDARVHESSAASL